MLILCSKIIFECDSEALFLLFDLVFKLYDVIVDLSTLSHCFLRPPAAVNVDNKQPQRTSLDREKADEQIMLATFFSS